MWVFVHSLKCRITIFLRKVILMDRITIRFSIIKQMRVKNLPNWSQNSTEVLNEITLLILMFYKIIKHYYRFRKYVFDDSQLSSNFTYPFSLSLFILDFLKQEMDLTAWWVSQSCKGCSSRGESPADFNILI